MSSAGASGAVDPTTSAFPGEAVGLGWPSAGALDPDGPGPEPTPDGVDVAATLGDVSRETGAPAETGTGLGWAG